MVMSEKVALPIHFFCPLVIHVPPSFLHVLVSPPAAPDPTSGSVSPKAPITSIFCIPDSHPCFCCSEPQLYIQPMAKPLCTPNNVDREVSTLGISMARNPSNKADLPGQP